MQIFIKGTIIAEWTITGSPNVMGGTTVEVIPDRNCGVCTSNVALVP